MMAAATSFSSLSSELGTNAAAYESVISQLTGSEWQGPSSSAMAAAAQQNIEWLQTTSVQLQEAAAKATASAAAYEAAFSASIPPPVVFANRAQLAALVATNILGQNTPAIAANEAMYGEFWAQDATAMTRVRRQCGNRRAGDAVDRADPEHQPRLARELKLLRSATQSTATRRTPGSTGCSAACRAHRVLQPTRSASVGGELTGACTTRSRVLRASR